jgi:hypothetical protein
MPGLIESFALGWVNARERHAGETAGDVASSDADSLVGELEETRQSLAELAETAEGLQARVAELEAEREASPVALLADVLRLPGVKNWLLSRHHPDRHPDANDVERRVLTETLQKIIAAYEILERGK